MIGAKENNKGNSPRKITSSSFDVPAFNRYNTDTTVFRSLPINLCYMKSNNRVPINDRKNIDKSKYTSTSLLARAIETINKNIIEIKSLVEEGKIDNFNFSELISNIESIIATVQLNPSTVNNDSIVSIMRLMRTCVFTKDRKFDMIFMIDEISQYHQRSISQSCSRVLASSYDLIKDKSIKINSEYISGLLGPNVIKLFSLIFEAKNLSMDNFESSRSMRSFFTVLVHQLFSCDEKKAEAITMLIYNLYSKNLFLRTELKNVLLNAVDEINIIFIKGICLQDGFEEAEYTRGLKFILQILSSIISGFAIPLYDYNVLMLKTYLLPLYKPKFLPLYQDSLHQCMINYVIKDNDLVFMIGDYLLRNWPVISSDKICIFLEEFVELIKYLKVCDNSRRLIELFLHKLLLGLNTYHSKVVEIIMTILADDIILKTIHHLLPVSRLYISLYTRLKSFAGERQQGNNSRSDGVLCEEDVSISENKKNNEYLEYDTNIQNIDDLRRVLASQVLSTCSLEQYSNESKKYFSGGDLRRSSGRSFSLIKIAENSPLYKQFDTTSRFSPVKKKYDKFWASISREAKKKAEPQEVQRYLRSMKLNSGSNDVLFYSAEYCY